MTMTAKRTEQTLKRLRKECADEFYINPFSFDRHGNSRLENCKDALEGAIHPKKRSGGNSALTQSLLEPKKITTILTDYPELAGGLTEEELKELVPSTLSTEQTLSLEKHTASRALLHQLITIQNNLDALASQKLTPAEYAVSQQLRQLISESFKYNETGISSTVTMIHPSRLYGQLASLRKQVAKLKKGAVKEAFLNLNAVGTKNRLQIAQEKWLSLMESLSHPLPSTPIDSPSSSPLSASAQQEASSPSWKDFYGLQNELALKSSIPEDKSFRGKALKDPVSLASWEEKKKVTYQKKVDMTQDANGQYHREPIYIPSSPETEHHFFDLHSPNTIEELNKKLEELKPSAWFPGRYAKWLKKTIQFYQDRLNHYAKQGIEPMESIRRALEDGKKINPIDFDSRRFGKDKVKFDNFQTLIGSLTSAVQKAEKTEEDIPQTPAPAASSSAPDPKRALIPLVDLAREIENVPELVDIPEVYTGIHNIRHAWEVKDDEAARKNSLALAFENLIDSVFFLARNRPELLRKLTLQVGEQIETKDMLAAIRKVVSEYLNLENKTVKSKLTITNDPERDFVQFVLAIRTALSSSKAERPKGLPPFDSSLFLQLFNEMVQARYDTIHRDNQPLFGNMPATPEMTQRINLENQAVEVMLYALKHYQGIKNQISFFSGDVSFIDSSLQKIETDLRRLLSSYDQLTQKTDPSSSLLNPELERRIQQVRGLLRSTSPSPRARRSEELKADEVRRFLESARAVRDDIITAGETLPRKLQEMKRGTIEPTSQHPGTPTGISEHPSREGFVGSQPGTQRRHPSAETTPYPCAKGAETSPRRELS